MANESAAATRSYVWPYQTNTIHLASFQSASSVATFCGRSWPLRDAGISTDQPRGPLCVTCRKAEARRAR